VANDLLLAANGANVVALQSYDNQRGYFENNLADSLTKKGKFRSGVSIHDISKPGEMREIAFLEIPGLGVNRTHWTGGALRLRVGTLRRLHRPHPVRGRSEQHHQARDRVALVAARDEPDGGRKSPPRRRASATRCTTCSPPANSGSRRGAMAG